MTNTTDRSVGVIPVYLDGQTILFCLVQHAAGHWGLPKGHCEPGESDEEAACRELAEETGIVDVELDLTRTFSEHYAFDKDGAHHEKDVVYFLGIVKTMEDEPAPGFKEEIIGVKWLSYEDARREITFEEGRQVLEQAWDFLTKRVK